MMTLSDNRNICSAIGLGYIKYKKNAILKPVFALLKAILNIIHTQKNKTINLYQK